MKQILIIIIIIFLTGCTRTTNAFEENINIQNKSIIIFKQNDNLSLLLKYQDEYILFLLNNQKKTDKVLTKLTEIIDYLIVRSNYLTNVNYNYKYVFDKEIIIDKIKFIKTDKIIIEIENNKFCIYDQKISTKNNYQDCKYVYLYNYQEDIDLNLTSNTKLVLFNENSKFNQRFLETIYSLWIDTYSITNKEITIITFYEDNYRLDIIPRDILITEN